ncbi:Uncharacterised protein [Mycobacteroides abscessus subsp. abscessus]|uniref:DUF4433 domain-containing protein n=1 Tax=Mycobacteroides abscessus TaxID=36809 RepID=UPI0009272337|nr:DUF4433 domain-containing protein [Mycobacteroides abscessus]SIC60008.1 Uncharacterised protein [Mycobacteroides abscessus subsp. abscessus]SIC92083.1 Uncharacterised protein [Mycobacteroides abscessus subsp. abscessus]SID11856.1 Uncharacterised protein [Mycobacteroides abscessus subsp. abscessus]SID17257.1 Uncharacterised protein [Mycobacteroides abscessus subsp. abscessus]SKT52086.1 Uncharacterised protein [Mycobacteroides abscessus subsp. abscessus]
MAMSFFPDSGFVGRDGSPRPDAPRDWVVWHFTHITNLPSIIGRGELLPDDMITPVTAVANDEVKERRRFNLVLPHKGYPPAMVSAHVPFYIAAKSPMLYVVCRGHGNYKGGPTPLVHLGVALGDLIDAGLTWAISNGNAASKYAAYSNDLDTVGEFVDFELLCQKEWDNTPEDGNRKHRRSAEVLIQGTVPINLIRYICCLNTTTLDTARAHFADVGGIRDYKVQPAMFY